MGFLTSDGLSLMVGDGASSEVFLPLRGAEIQRFEITQTLQDTPAIRSDAWREVVGMTDRRVMLECTAIASDEAAATRVRTLALLGNAGNFRLQCSAAQHYAFSAHVTNYRELLQGGTLKRLQFEVASSTAVTVA